MGIILYSVCLDSVNSRTLFTQQFSSSQKHCDYNEFDFRSKCLCAARHKIHRLTILESKGNIFDQTTFHH